MPINKNSFSVPPQSEGPFRRGVFRYILLQYLKEKPSHGYEIIQALRERFHGLYMPSAGTIYPRLHKLEEKGFVTSEERDGRKIYTITDAGHKFLLEHSDLEQEISDHLDDWRNPENTEAIRKTMREFGRLTELLSWEARKMDSEKLERIRAIISRAYGDIDDILRS